MPNHTFSPEVLGSLVKANLYHEDGTYDCTVRYRFDEIFPICKNVEKDHPNHRFEFDMSSAAERAYQQFGISGIVQRLDVPDYVQLWIAEWDASCD